MVSLNDTPILSLISWVIANKFLNFYEHQFSQILNDYLLNSYYEPGNAINSKDEVVNDIDKLLFRESAFDMKNPHLKIHN